VVIKIDIWGTILYRFRRIKKGCVTTQPTIQKISDDRNVLSKTYIIISIEIYVK
jgi:hypothetical protein